MRILGVDCATDPRKTGLCCWEEGRLLHAELGRAPVAARLAEWIEPGRPTLLALDAPLGWPAKLGPSLASHRAGRRLEGDADELFRRATDRFVQQRVGKTPLDVGADRIARTARVALVLLDELRRLTGEPIPLAWSPDDVRTVAAIEVYPAATLKQRGWPDAGYKRPQDRAVRERIVDLLGVRERCETLLEHADVLDAVLCTLAGRDFLDGLCPAPDDVETASAEGWIWVQGTA